MKLKLLLFISLFSLAAHSQKKSEYSDHYIAEFFLKDGTTIKGYFRGEIYSTTNFGLIPKSTISSFRYTTIGDEKKKKIDADNVGKIYFYDNNELVKIQEKIFYKEVDKKGNLSKKTKTKFEYLLYDGKMKLYGSNEFICEGGCGYVQTNFYIKSNAEPFPVLATKPKGLISMRLGSSIINTVDAFRIVGGKCTEFSEYLNFFEQTMIKEKDLGKQLEKEYAEIFKETMTDLKNKKFSGQYAYELADRIQEHQMKIFTGIISEYEKSCP